MTLQGRALAPVEIERPERPGNFYERSVMPFLVKTLIDAALIFAGIFLFNQQGNIWFITFLVFFATVERTIGMIEFLRMKKQLEHSLLARRVASKATDRKTGL
jgi:hypothetical protein